jgi:hypothetical protein
MQMKKIMMAGAVVVCAGFSLAAEPLLRQDFNTLDGKASLKNGIPAGKWEARGEASFSNDDLPLAAKGGYAGFVRNTAYAVEGKQFFYAGRVGELRSMTLGGWIKTGTDFVYFHGWFLNNQETEGRAGFGLNVTSNGMNLVLCVNAKPLDTGVKIDPDQWTFVAVSYDGGKSVNNVTVYVAKDADTLTVKRLTLNQGAVRQSKNTIVSGTFFGKASIDSLRLYGSANGSDGILSENEVREWMKDEPRPVILGSVCMPGPCGKRI